MDTKRRLNVHLYVIPNCNLQCKHCYYNALSLHAPIQEPLTIPQMAAIITSLCDTYDTYFDVEGGEFFLRQDVAELFNMLPVDYLGRLTITTNGVTRIDVSPPILQQLDEFRVSVEGHTDELQHDIRGIKLKPVLKTCYGLMEAGVPITLRITLHKKNHNQVADMLTYFIGKGFSKFSLYEFQATGRGCLCETEYALCTNELEESIRQLADLALPKQAAAVKLSLSARRIDLVRAYESRLTAGGYTILSLAGAASLTVNYNGDLGVCPWNVGNDNIGKVNPAQFMSSIHNSMDTGQLDHQCVHCSAIRIRN